MSDKPLEYTPTIIHENNGDVYLTVMIQGARCQGCSLVMIQDWKSDAIPVYWKASLSEQAKRASVVFRSYTHDASGKELCKACAPTKGGFVCAMCNQRQRGDLSKVSFGDPAEHMCLVCYETRSAKEWDELAHRLLVKHQYDFC